jgi:hypothetical protein
MARMTPRTATIPIGSRKPGMMKWGEGKFELIVGNQKIVADWWAPDDRGPRPHTNMYLPRSSARDRREDEKEKASSKKRTLGGGMGV